MVEFNFKEQLTAQKLFKENCSPDTASEWTALSKALCHKVIENDGYITGITLSCPDECNNPISLAFFLSIFNYPYHIGPNKTTVTFD